MVLTCTDRAGINGLITRAVNTRFDLRYLLDLIKSAGLKIKSPIAATSSAAYPGSFASKYMSERPSEVKRS